MYTVRRTNKTGNIGRAFCNIALFFVAFLPQACSTPKPTNSTQSTRTPVTLTIGLPIQAEQKDPLRGAMQAARLISREGLTLPNRTGRALPRLAESWIESADGLTWRFKLRANAMFHDQTAVDGTSVKASLERSLATSDLVQYPGLADIVSIEAPSAGEVLIRLRARSTFLLDDLGVAILKVQPDRDPIAAGPYVPVATSENELSLRAFERYYGGTPQITRIVLKAYPTVRTAWAAMMRGEIDFLYEVGQDAREFIEGESSVAVFPFVRHYVYTVALNSRRKPFDNPQVRRALNYSVDREFIVEHGFKGHGMAASGSAWPQHWAFDSSVETYSLDPARASALLDAAGLAARNAPATAKRPSSRLHFTCLVPEGFPLWERLGLLVQRSFSRIGVDMTLQEVTVKEFNARIAAGDFDAIVSEFIVGNSPSRPYTFWHSTSKQNFLGYKNPRVDEALEGIRRASNDTEYKAAFRSFQTSISADPPAVFLALGEISRAVNRRFRVIAPAGSDILSTIADWEIAESPEITN